MAYTRTTWVSGETPLSASNLNNIEDGIEELNTGILDVVRVMTFSKTNFQINANSYAYASIPYTPQEGFGNPIVVNVQINSIDTTSPDGQHQCFCYNAYKTGTSENTLIAYIKNTANYAAKITVQVTVLFLRTSS